MSEQEKKRDGPDFAQGVALADIAERGMILGHVAGEEVLLARRGHQLHCQFPPRQRLGRLMRRRCVLHCQFLLCQLLALP